jgi:RNA polymerase sigma-70 factor (ECF subfamily)
MKLVLIRRQPAVPRDMPPEEPDEALVVRALSGDTRSKRELYLRHVHYLVGMSTRLLRSTEAAEDVVQETFVIAFSKLRSIHKPAAFRGWLASIAVSQIHRRFARDRLLRRLGLDRRIDDAPLDELAREDLSVEARSELAALNLILQELPPRERIAWMLRYVDGEPLEAVAEACRCSLATVKRWIARADARIREHVCLTGEEGP